MRRLYSIGFYSLFVSLLWSRSIEWNVDDRRSFDLFSFFLMTSSIIAPLCLFCFRFAFYIISSYYFLGSVTCYLLLLLLLVLILSNFEAFKISPMS